MNPADGSRTLAVTIDEVLPRGGQAGLLGLSAASGPARHQSRGYVYTAYTYDADAGPEVALRMKVRRYTYDKASQRLSASLDILSNSPTAPIMAAAG